MPLQPGLWEDSSPGGAGGGEGVPDWGCQEVLSGTALSRLLRWPPEPGPESVIESSRPHFADDASHHDSAERKGPWACRPATSSCKVMNTDSSGTVHLPAAASCRGGEPPGMGRRDAADRARTAFLLGDSPGLPS